MVEEVRPDPSTMQYNDLPFSHAIKHEDFVFVSGQAPRDADGNVPETFEGQARQELENIQTILEEAGTSMDNLVKVKVYVEDMDRFGELNEIYQEYVSEPFPARAAIGVEELAKNFVVEFEAVAAVE